MTDRNANRPGYKKTSAGWIPEEWECSRVDEVCSLTAGGTPDTTVQKYWDGPIPWVTTSEIDYAPIKQTEQTITEDGLANSAAKVFPSGTLVMAMYGQGATRGRVATLACAATMNQACVAIVPDSKCIPTFLYQQFCHDYIRLRKLSQGGGQPNLSTELIGWMPIPLPPLSEQKKIAEILSTWDEAIEQTRALIAAATRRKKALMQQLLTGKKRLVGSASSVRKQTPLGSMPVDWPLKRLGDVFEKVSRKNDAGVTRVLTASGREGLIDQRRFFNKTVASEDTSGYYLLQRGEFAYNRSAMDGYPYGAIKRLDLYDQGTLSTLYSCLALKDIEGISDFYVYLFELGLLNRQLRGIAHVGGRAHGLLNVTDSDFYEVRIPAPPLAEQRAIATVLTTADEELKALEARLAALSLQKKGLMQKLLTGEVRVKP